MALVLGLLGAGLVYIATSRDAGSGGGIADTPVVVARSDIPARTTITQSMVDVRLVSSESRSGLAYSDVTEVSDR